jgi:gliding motility-associated-like protein
MNIFNRWGQLIFTDNDSGSGWDGTMDGNPCQMDVYSYIVTYTITGEDGGSKQISGTVALIR